MWNFDQIYQKIDRLFFKIISEEASTNHPLKNLLFKKNGKKNVSFWTHVLTIG